MSMPHSSSVFGRAARQADICSCLSKMSVSNSRSISSSSLRLGIPTIHGEKHQAQPSTKPSAISRATTTKSASVVEASHKDLSPLERAKQAAERARARLQEQQQKFSEKQTLGGLADNSLFYDKEDDKSLKDRQEATTSDKLIGQRDYQALSLVLNPRPTARARWQRKMVIKHVQRRGRLPKRVHIARTEREHLSKSHFFKTSMKKLAPLARQIAGKPIDEAILQMRFSKKKAAVEVRKHLVQARDEAIVYRGLGISSETRSLAETTESVITDPAISPALPHQTPTKTRKPGVVAHDTDIYIAQAWVGRGPFTDEPEFRARGRVNLLRHPATSLSVLLKEEKTRAREKADKEEKSIRKRLGKQMWTQLPDRPITRQSQYVLW